MTQEATASLWDVYRGGKVATCPNDAGSLALSVDAASGYRLVCTQCGTASPWFEAGTGGIQVRSLAVAADSDFDD